MELSTSRNTNFVIDKILQVFWGGAKYAVRSDVDLIFAYYHEEQNSFQGGTPATSNTAHCSNASLAQCSGQLDTVNGRFAPTAAVPSLCEAIASLTKELPRPSAPQEEPIRNRTSVEMSRDA